MKAVRHAGDETYAVVEALGRPVAQASADVRDDALSELLDGARQPHEGLEPAPAPPPHPFLERGARHAWLSAAQELRQRLLEEVRAVEALVGLLDRAEPGLLVL